MNGERVNLSKFAIQDGEESDKFAMPIEPAQPVGYAQVPAYPITRYQYTQDTFLNQQVPQLQICYNSGSHIVVDESRNAMYALSQRNGKWHEDLFCRGRFLKSRKLEVFFSKKQSFIYFLVDLIDKDSTSKTVLISEEDLNDPRKVFNVFKEQGIFFPTHTRPKNKLDLLLSVLYANIKGETLVYPCSPGWYNGCFRYNDGDVLLNTPYFTKKLDVNSELSPAEAGLLSIEQVKKTTRGKIALIFIILLHYAIISSRLPQKYMLKKPFVIYGESNKIANVANLLLKFYNRNEIGITNFHDKDFWDKYNACKDEIFLIRDEFCTGYKKEVSLKKYGEMLNYIRNGNCDCICVILSDNGIVTGDEKNIHFTLSDVQTTDAEDEAIVTHLIYFTKWIADKEITVVKVSDSGDGEKDEVIDLFYGIFAAMAKYYHKNCNINLFKKLGFNDLNSVFEYITEFVEESIKYTEGDWICDVFKDIYFKLKRKNKLSTYEKKGLILFASNDLNLFLDCYPQGVRRIDVLKALRKFGVLATDSPERFTKNMFLNGKVIDTIAIDKSFLEPDIGDV